MSYLLQEERFQPPNRSHFLKISMLAVVGEGEQTMLDIVNQFKIGGDFSQVKGIVYQKKAPAKSKRRPEGA